MKFTLIFSGAESADLSIGCVYAPCLLWKVGGRTVLNPHPDFPLYRKGDFHHLIETAAVGAKIKESERQMCLVVHKLGHGTPDCLKALNEDLLQYGFEPTVVMLH